MVQTTKLIKNFLNTAHLEVEQKEPEFACDSNSFYSCNDRESYKGAGVACLLCSC